MKPERRIAADIVLNDDKRGILSILQKTDKIDLNVLKSQTGLSNKKWDKTIKSLTKLGLAKVRKTDDGLFVEVVE